MITLDRRLADSLHAAVDDWHPNYPGLREPGPAGRSGQRVVPGLLAGGLAAGAALVLVAWPPDATDTVRPHPAASTAPTPVSPTESALTLTAEDDGRTVDVRVGQEVRVLVDRTPCGVVAMDLQAVRYVRATEPPDGADESALWRSDGAGSLTFRVRAAGSHRLGVYVPTSSDCPPGKPTVEIDDRPPTWSVTLRAS